MKKNFRTTLVSIPGSAMEGGSMDVGGGYRRSRRKRTNVPWYVESSALDEKSSGDEFSEGDEEENQKDLSSKDLFEKYQHSAAVVTKVDFKM